MVLACRQQILGPYLDVHILQSFQLQGDFPPGQGLCPWTWLAASPSQPRYMLALHAYYVPEPLPLPEKILIWAPMTSLCSLTKRYYRDDTEKSAE